jgi:hypothetical protein
VMSTNRSTPCPRYRPTGASLEGCGVEDDHVLGDLGAAEPDPVDAAELELTVLAGRVHDPADEEELARFGPARPHLCACPGAPGRAKRRTGCSRLARGRARPGRASGRRCPRSGSAERARARARPERTQSAALPSKEECPRPQRRLRNGRHAAVRRDPAVAAAYRALRQRGPTPQRAVASGGQLGAASRPRASHPGCRVREPRRTGSRRRSC